MKPMIAIVPSFSTQDHLYQCNKAYADALFLAGGLPVMLPYFETIPSEIFSIFSGIVFSGGGDFDPLLFSQQPHPLCGSITPERDKMELQLCQLSLMKNIPVLGICRGAQLLALASGGSIYQDITSLPAFTIKHIQSAPKYHACHSIKITKESCLFTLFSEETINVNSFHHQSIHRPGKDFLVSARSLDGAIEAIEHKFNHFALGLQWHPECMFEKDPRQLAPFIALIEACR